MVQYSILQSFIKNRRLLICGSFSFVALSSFNLWQAGICALRKGQRHVQRSLDLKLANAVEFIEAKLDVQMDDVGQMLAQTRTEQRAQYAELKRDIIDVYKCIIDVTGAVTSASTPLPPHATARAARWPTHTVAMVAEGCEVRDTTDSFLPIAVYTRTHRVCVAGDACGAKSKTIQIDCTTHRCTTSCDAAALGAARLRSHIPLPIRDTPVVTSDGYDVIPRN